MQLTFDFIDKPKKVVKPKKELSEFDKWCKLPKELKYRVSLKNYFAMDLHMRINYRTWYCYQDSHFCRQTFEQHCYLKHEDRDYSHFYFESYPTGQWK